MRADVTLLDASRQQFQCSPLILEHEHSDRQAATQSSVRACIYEPLRDMGDESVQRGEASEPSLPTPEDFPFPYPQPYDIQLELMRTVFAAIENRKIAIVSLHSALS